jgi:hypothetical protein
VFLFFFTVDVIIEESVKKEKLSNLSYKENQKMLVINAHKYS